MLLFDGGEEFTPTVNPQRTKPPAMVGDYVTVQPNWLGLGKPYISWLKAGEFLEVSKRVADCLAADTTVFEIAPLRKMKRESN